MCVSLVINIIDGFFKPKRMSRRMSLVLLLIFVLSIITLLKQTIDFYWSRSCCLDAISKSSMTFDDYGSFFIRYSNLNFHFPISLLGIVLLTFLLFQIQLIANFPSHYSIHVDNPIINLSLNIKEESIHFFKNLLIFELFLSCLMVFNLLYIEFFLLRGLCLLCIVSQISIVLITILILIWSPFKP